jgi:hypothetical protein
MAVSTSLQPAAAPAAAGPALLLVCTLQAMPAQRGAGKHTGVSPAAFEPIPSSPLPPGARPPACRLTAEINFVVIGVILQMASVATESTRLTLVQILLQVRRNTGQHIRCGQCTAPE